MSTGMRQSGLWSRMAFVLPPILSWSRRPLYEGLQDWQMVGGVRIAAAYSVSVVHFVSNPTPVVSKMISL